QSQDDTCMLNTAIRVKQLGTNNSDFRALSVIKHFLKPLLLNDCSIVIQQHQIFATRLPNGHVVDGCIIEWTRVAQHPQLPLVEFGNSLEPLTSFRGLTVIIDN